VIFFLAVLLGLAVLSAFKSDPGSPPPPALSPPRSPRGFGRPTHYTFSRLTVVPDLISIALAMGRIGPRVQNLPCVNDDMARRVVAALSDMGDATEHLANWLRYDNPRRISLASTSAEAHLAAEALRRVHDLCEAAAKGLDRFQALDWSGMKFHAAWAVSGVLSDHFAEFEEGIWAFHPDEEDLGQYDDLDLVGNVNRHEAADLNRTAASFLSRLHASRLPELMRFCHESKPFQTARGVRDTQGRDWSSWNIWDGPKPGLLRRAVFWARGMPWEYPHRQTPIFEDDNDGGGREKEDYEEGYKEDFWSNNEFLRYKISRLFRKSAEPYFQASAWHSAVASQRIVRERVLPLVRETQAGLAQAQALYEKQVAEPSQRLKRQVADLIAGRGWEFVERVQIGMTADGHWLEVSRAEAKAIPLTDVRNTTIWRRMFLPLDVRTADQLKSIRLKLRGW
ncbi:hypothetical protein B0I37DRAFT_437699, partial [Chaetomium sp. MPI-CAGE-AT-0009]